MPLQLTKSPSVDAGMLVRRSPHDVFEALADPSITTRFWYTKSSGRMKEGAELTWEWGDVRRLGEGMGEEDRGRPTHPLLLGGLRPSHPTTVEFLFIPYETDATYV